MPLPARAANDAFGVTSPHWNLPFPSGKLTAAEILAYCPHWLKSMDVIDRFVSNGSKAMFISSMLNRFRTLPNVTIPANSICVMMQCAMRAAGFTKWTMGDHSEVEAIRTKEWDHEALDVSSFRTPHITHPKKGSKKAENVFAEPIEFRDLAHNVKEHPSGPDALDLTRCVLYAVDHPDESWRFPVDFIALVKHLGGPQTPSHLHRDAQSFERRAAELSPPGSGRKKVSVTPAAKPVRFASTTTMVTTRNSDMRLSTPKKRGYNDEYSPAPDSGEKRRSSRIATLGLKNLREPDTDGSTPYTPYGNGDAYGPPQKKRKASFADDDFIGNHDSDSESLPDAHDDVSDHFLTPTSKRPTRASAQKGRRLTKEAVSRETPKTSRFTKGTKGSTFTGNATPAGIPTSKFKVPDALIDPVLLGQARTWDTYLTPAVKLPAPALGRNRLKIDEYNVYLYAEPGYTTRAEMWATAFSSSRPRKHAPFRELHRLSDPAVWDESDWAENIRWAKEQYNCFGVGTWTEYDYHLEQITEWRRETRWVSEEVASGGRMYQ